ncbi:MAG: glycosyltransferase family 39 protein [Candidatus Aenigmarchaeota archaeon]|nr:glycosyltransferase family 39 protein [Candidatus Aenigmarchaeota archaeon]
MLKLTKTEIKLFLTFFIISALFIHWGGWYENSIFSLTRAIVDEHRFEINSFANQTSDRAYFNGNYYSDKAPLTAVIGIPSYALSKSLFPNYVNTTFYYPFFQNNETSIFVYKDPGIFTYFSMILFTLSTSVLLSSLSVILFYRILQNYFKDQKTILLLSFIFAFATMIFPYSLSVSVLPTAMFFLLLSFYFILKEKNNRTNLIFAGIFLGLSFTADYTIVVLFLFFFAYLVATKKTLTKILLFALSFVASLLPLMTYNYILLGTPFTFMQKYMDEQVFSTVPKEILDNYGFLYPNLGVIFQILIGSYRGIFFYYPILLLSFVGLFYMRKNFKIDMILFLLIFFGYVIFNSARVTWHGGYTFGPRYLFYTIPFLVIPLGFTFRDFKSFPFKIVFFIFLSLSVFTNILSLQLLEDAIIDSKTLLIQEKYQQIANSFGLLPNVLFNHYLNLFLHFGPRSMIIENLAEGHFDIDIRDIPYSRDWELPYHSGANPFWSYPLILGIPLLIWFNDIKGLRKKK